MEDIFSGRQMEAMSVPPEIIEAAKEGDVDTLRSWFESGTRDPNVLFYSEFVGSKHALLHLVLSPPTSYANRRSDRVDAVRLLLAHGADANLCRGAPYGIGVTYAPLMLCQFQGEMDALLDGGAEVDARNGIGRTKLMNCFSNYEHGLVLAKLLLRRGANCYLQDDDGLDAEATTLRHGYGDSKNAIINLIREVKSAGSWKAYARAPRVELVRLRSLCVRGRATPPHAASGMQTLSVAEMVIFERLFAFPSSPTTKTKAAPLPNEVFWHVLSFWRSSRDV